MISRESSPSAVLGQLNFFVAAVAGWLWSVDLILFFMLRDSAERLQE